jgi:lipopolysaccharide/colanic/teichoic acid biosynthesis glycosyltransferase
MISQVLHEPRNSLWSGLSGRDTRSWRPQPSAQTLGRKPMPLDRTWNSFWKRLVDIAGAAVGLVLSFPLLCVFACLVYRESPGPVFFSQCRVGRRGRVFKMFKLRTMKLGAERDDHRYPSTTPDDPRLLRIGRLMRRLNVDEVPQFWNVLRGDMSLVGPRPERPTHSAILQDQIPNYTQRCASKPGMTGWAQINGFRGATSLKRRLRCDLFYLEHWSLLLDLKIMTKTLFLQDPAFQRDLQRLPATFSEGEVCIQHAEPARMGQAGCSSPRVAKPAIAFPLPELAQAWGSLRSVCRPVIVP